MGGIEVKSKADFDKKSMKVSSAFVQWIQMIARFAE